MKIHFDEQADALYIRLNDAQIVASEEVKPGIILDTVARLLSHGDPLRA